MTVKDIRIKVVVPFEIRRPDTTVDFDYSVTVPSPMRLVDLTNLAMPDPLILQGVMIMTEDSPEYEIEEVIEGEATDE